MREVFDKYIMREFVYGESDCCQFVAECIEAQTGVNPAGRFKYASEKAANNLLDMYGGLEALVTDVLGEPVDTPREGYVALVEKPTLLGIVHRGRIVARTPGDINDIPLSRARRFWSPCPR